MFEILAIVGSALAVVYAAMEKVKVAKKVNHFNNVISEKDEKIRIQDQDISLLYKQLNAANKKLEEEIKRAFEASKSEGKRLKAQIYSSAHEMRQPVERMRGYVLLLEMEDFSKKPSDVIGNMNAELHLLDQRLMNLAEHGLR